jgi:hypothetical protein
VGSAKNSGRSKAAETIAHGFDFPAVLPEIPLACVNGFLWGRLLAAGRCNSTSPGHFFVWSDELKNGKTRRVNGVDCHEGCFAFVPNPDDTNSWRVCLHIPGDPAKTINAIKNALGRFNEMEGVPDSERDAVWHAIRGAAICMGLRVVEPPKLVEPVIAKRKKDPALEAVIALADRRADEMLRAMGLE